jgi:sulfide:quinone oxidoreductase
MNAVRTKVMIAGGGVAALEGLMALHELAGEHVDLELVTPSPEFAYRPLAVAEPFGLGESRRFDVVRIARDHGAAIHIAGVRSVDTAAKSLLTWDGRELRFDVLLVAIGAQAVTGIPGSVTIQGPGYTGRFRALLRELEAERGLDDVRLSVVTPEEAPLQLFGTSASQAVRELLDERGIELHASHHASGFADGRLALVPGEPLPVERVVSLPGLVGPRLSGLPSDGDGFIPVDLNGLVRGEEHVYAAGDATNSAIKQGGIAAQQADAAAAAIAARAGADIDPEPFRPVLRGMLLTGAAPRYMRAEVSGGRGEDWRVSDSALWWPPSKIAGRRLAPYLALRHDELDDHPDGHQVEVDVPLSLPPSGKPVAR